MLVDLDLPADAAGARPAALASSITPPTARCATCLSTAVRSSPTAGSLTLDQAGAGARLRAAQERMEAAAPQRDYLPPPRTTRSRR